MNLQALYDLKERLEYAAIAGTGLMQEDFRLRRAVEAMAPLAGVNPVFAKISAAAKALLNAPQEERSKRLLDVLSLVDAVVYTQGVSNISGDLVPSEPGTGTYVEVSYGELQPLLTALSGTGSGRSALIQKCYAERPEYFSDFRVLPHVVKALGDNYAELADFIATILMKQGSAMIPLLKDGYDPGGKMEMTRRVRLIAKLAGACENDWFVSILPDSKKDVREAIIQALSLSQDNGQLLLDLCQSERGKLKEAALRSLAMMEDPACIDFLRKEIQKKPDNVGFLKGVGSEVAADLAADAIQAYLEKLKGRGNLYDSRELDDLVKLTGAVCGKYSQKIRALWINIVDQMDALDAIKPESLIRGCDLSVAEHLQRCMLQTVLWNPCPVILDLAAELCERSRKWFLCCRFLADLLMCPGDVVYTSYASGIVPTGLLKLETKKMENERVQLMMGFAALRWDEGLQGFCLVYAGCDSLNAAPQTHMRPIPEIDERWAVLLADHSIRQEVDVYDLGSMHYPRKIQTGTDFILMQMIDPRNSHVREVCGAYFYKRAMMTGKLGAYWEVLLRCGWKNWSGLLAHCAVKENQISYHKIMELLVRLPVTNGEKAAELKQLNALVQTGRVSVWGRIWPAEQIEMMIAQMESNPNLVTDQGEN